MPTVAGSRKCIAHWATSGGWHRCDRVSPHRGGRHQCVCGDIPRDPADWPVGIDLVFKGRQSFRYHEARGEFQCHA